MRPGLIAPMSVRWNVQSIAQRSIWLRNWRMPWALTRARCCNDRPSRGNVERRPLFGSSQ